MTDIETTNGEKTYTFRGKTFSANPATVKELNYALALNRSTERYVEVAKQSKKKES